MNCRIDYRCHVWFALLLLAVLPACTPRGPSLPTPGDPASARRIDSGEIVGFANPAGGYSWLGIPYAAPPIGDLRWRAPQPAKAWSGNRNTLLPGEPCIQYGSQLGGVGTPGSQQGSEDCLYVNVYSPRETGSDAKGSALPVMVWIHGGGNTVGHGAFVDGGALAARENVIVVTLNYRLGPFGWFVPPGNPRLEAHGPGDLDASGNYGSLDVVAALRWVQRNARAFGGDPGNVTVFGESAGGTNALALLVTPAAEGLFHRLIVQSLGFGFSAVPADESPVSTAAVLRKLLVSQGRAADAAAADALARRMPAEEQTAFLRSLDPWTLYAAYPRPGSEWERIPSVFQDGVVVRRGDLATLLADPATHIDVPTILGTNRDEPKIFMAFDPRLVRSAFGLPYALRDPVSYELEARYRSLLWKADGVDSIAAPLAAYGAPAYAYRWDWDEQGKAYGMIDLSTVVGAAHGLEIPFVFGFFDLGPRSELLFHERNAAARLELSGRMMAYWAEFAATGNPGRGRSAAGTPWLPWSAEVSAPRMMVFDTPAGGGIRMLPSNITRDTVVAAMQGEGLTDAEHCQLFRATFRNRQDVWADTAWERYAAGRCSGPRLMSQEMASSE
ncbi:MAG: carboxylesterase family protein [Sinobacteraceae bacterium]|nr:carboxylesterase family protein [Nevskiaceae bacterium]